MLRGLATAVIGTILLLATLGIALGALLGDTELFNPATGAAQAKDMEAQTQLDMNRAQLELERREEEIAGQQAAAELELEKLQEEMAAQQEAAKLDLAHKAEIYRQAEERGELEMRHYETTLAQEQAFLERQHKLQLQQRQQAFERELAMMELRQIILLGAGSGALVVATTAVAYDLYSRGKALHAPQPASFVSRRRVIMGRDQVILQDQDQPGGDGRGPRVRTRGQG
jgi:hypothetical protein